MRLADRTVRHTFIFVVVAMLLGGCHPGPVGLTSLPAPTSPEVAPPRISGAIPANIARNGAVFSLGTASSLPSSPPPSPSNVSRTGDITLNFVDTDIREVARVILGKTLKLTYTIDPKVQGTATLDTGKPLRRSALLPTLEALLNQNGATLVRRDGLYEVVPISEATVTNAVGGAAGGRTTGTQVIVLRYADAADLAKVLQPYVAPGGKVTADPSRNALIISGDAAAREALSDLIRAFDVDTLAGQSFAVFPVTEGDANAQAAALVKALHTPGSGVAEGMVQIVPLPRVNAVLVASPQPRLLIAARRFFQVTEHVENATARAWHVYYIQNGQAADLANLLQRAFTPARVTAPAAGSTAPGAQQRTMTAGPLFQTSGFNTPASGTANGATGLSTTPASPASPGAANAGASIARAAEPAAPPATEPLSSESEDGTASRVRIIADRRNNALLIYATPSEYAVIHDMLRKIDIVPLQVLIDATIAEVTLNHALQYGTQFYFNLDHVAQTLGSVPITFPPTTLGSTGLVGFAISRAPNFILQALADVTKVKVLSSPQVLVMDNEPARLQVGQQVPILTGTATSTLTTGAPIVNSVDYHSTGVIMQVTPRINSGDLITLDVAQEVSNVAPAAPNTVTGSPTFDDRILKTSVAVQDGQTVALAGLITDTATTDNNGVPFLKDIPVLSTLLSTQSNSRQRTELLILITPHIVHDQRDAYALTEDLRHELSAAAVVKPELSRLPVPGLANPNGL